MRVFAPTFPGLSGSSLGGGGTNPYKASIMERKVAATDADDVQKKTVIHNKWCGVMLLGCQVLIMGSQLYKERRAVINLVEVRSVVTETATVSKFELSVSSNCQDANKD
ncbi:hypothetical protein PAMP_020733 [Pampus punctatissimus]